MRKQIVGSMLVGLMLAAPTARGEETPSAPPAPPAPAAPSGTDAGTPTAGAGEGAAVAPTKDDLEGVRNEVQVLRDQWQRSLDRNVAQAGRALAVSGSAQTRYLRSEDKAVPNTFGINTVLLGFKGNLRKDYEEGKNLDYAIGFSAGSDFTLKPNDAFLTYALFGTLDKEGSRLSVSAGQQKKPFSLEASTTEEFKPTIRGAQFSSGLGLDGRDIGVVVSGDLFAHVDYAFNYRVPTVAYSLGIISGAGSNKADDNAAKDLVGRVVFAAPVDWSHPLRGLALGASVYRGKKTSTATLTEKTQRTVTDTSGKPVTITTKTATSKILHDGAKNRWGVDLAYVNTPVGFTLEYAQGETDGKLEDATSVNGTLTTPAKFGVARSEGYAATIFYNFGDQFVKAIKNQERYDDWYPLTYQPFVRFDRWVADLGDRGAHTDVFTLGFNWFFAQTTKLQVNYNFKRESPTAVRDDEFLIQFQFGF